MRPENQIDKTVTLSDFINHTFFLHHTSAQRNFQMRFLLFQTVQITESSVNALICVIPYRTGIIDDEIRVFFRIGQAIAGLYQDSRKLLRISGIHLAPEGYYSGKEWTAKPFTLRFYILFCFFYVIILKLRFISYRQILLFIIHSDFHPSAFYI